MKKSRCTSQMADNGIFTFFSFPKIFETHHLRVVSKNLSLKRKDASLYCIRASSFLLYVMFLKSINLFSLP